MVKQDVNVFVPSPHLHNLLSSVSISATVKQQPETLKLRIQNILYKDCRRPSGTKQSTEEIKQNSEGADVKTQMAFGSF